MNASNPAPRIAVRWALTALAVVVLLILAISISNRTVFSASSHVKAFQQLLVAGKGAEALGLLNATVPEGDAVALDGEVLQRTQQGISEFTVDRPVIDPQDSERVTVTAHYKAEGVDRSSTYALRHAGKSWLFFDQWEFEQTALPTVLVKANTVNEVSVNEQQIPLAEGRATLPVFYPAVLDAGFETTNFQADTRGVVITAPSSDPVQIPLRTEPTEHFTSAINDQVRDYLQECTKQKVLMPSDCPFAYHTTARVDAESIDWQIADYSPPEVSYYNGTWVLSPLTVSTELHLTEQDLRTGALENKVIKSDFGFHAKLETSTTEVSVRPLSESDQQVASAPAG